MALHQVLHMKGGDDISSYAKNSSFPRTVAMKSKNILERSIKELSSEFKITKFSDGQKCWIRIAELGCGSGPNSLSTIRGIVEVLDKELSHNNLNHGINGKVLDQTAALPSVEILLNDLVSNDFNLVFKSLPSFYDQVEKHGVGGRRRRQSGSCFVAAVPGSFYGRLIPDKSIHFFYSSQSLHWLSQVPAKLTTDTGLSLNKGNVHIGKTSPPAVHEAYLEQFKSDLTTFLRMRSKEMVTRGRMVLILCSYTPGSVGFLYLDQTLNDMVTQGTIEEEAFDSFNIPMFEPTMDEMKWIIEEEGSFELDQIETIQWNKDDDIKDIKDQTLVMEMYVRVTRAVFGSILGSHFGEGIMDDLFCRFASNVFNCGEDFNWTQDSLVVSLVKKD